jgi:hypothetical protein
MTALLPRTSAWKQCGSNPAHTSSPTCTTGVPANSERASICGLRQHGRTATSKALARSPCYFATSTAERCAGAAAAGLRFHRHDRLKEL